MFIRRKKNRSGTTSIVVVDKSGGCFKEIKSFGTARTENEIRGLSIKASEWISAYKGQGVLDFYGSEVRQAEVEETERVLSNLESILINGTQLLLSRVYDLIGFNAIDDDVLRYLVIARASKPMSKRATVDYLKSYYDEDISLNSIYRYMDKLYNTQMDTVQRISVAHTRQILGGNIGLMFYDVTTLYFETAVTDTLREPGFSKDGKTAESQVVLGLLVSEGGYPLSYSLYNGSQYEGFTMIPMIDDFRQRFGLNKDFVIVADSGLMTNRNLALLRQGGYKYILGARIKSEKSEIKEWIFSQHKEEGIVHELPKDNGERLILSYSQKRAHKDAYNRQKGVARLRKAYHNGTLTKEKVNRMGYNKFLELEDKVRVIINEDRIKQDEQWDGLKGYVTNTDLDSHEVIRQYRSLWVVERAFRVTKSTLEARPIFHFTERRIEAHICICFCAYKVYKELQRLAQKAGLDMSVDTILDIAKTITTVNIRLPYNQTIISKTMFLTDRHRTIQPLFDLLKC